MRKGHTSLPFQQFHHVWAKSSWDQIVSKAAGLDHSFNFEVVLNAEGQTLVRTLLENPFQANIRKSIQLSYSRFETPSGKGVEIFLTRMLQQFLDFLI